jgi:hypothetical protein
MKNKPRYDNDIINYFNLPDNTHVVYYQNPKLFYHLFLEMINPTHIGEVYGRNRNGNTRNIVRYAKIIIPSFALSTFFLTNNYFSFIIFSFFLSFFLWSFLLRLGNVKCSSVYKVD